MQGIGIASARRRAVVVPPGTLPVLSGGTYHTRYNARDEVLTDGATVATLTDRTGGGHDATKAGAGTLTYAATGLNGHPAYLVAGGAVNADTAAFTAIPSTSEVNIFAVMQWASAVSAAKALIGNPTGTGLRLGQSGTAWAAHRGGSSISGGTVDTSPHRVRLYAPASGAATATVSIDGSVVAGPAAIASSAQTAWRIFNYSTAQPFAGYLGELIITVGTLTAPDIAAIDAYFTANYGV